MSRSLEFQKKVLARARSKNPTQPRKKKFHPAPWAVFFIWPTCTGWLPKTRQPLPPSPVEFAAAFFRKYWPWAQELNGLKHAQKLKKLRGRCVALRADDHAVFYREINPAFWPDGTLEALTQEAETDQAAFEAAREAATFFIERGEPVPEALRCFAAKLIRGEARPPKRRGPSPYATLPQKKLIRALFLKLVSHYGLTPYRNEVIEPDSEAYAIDAIVEGGTKERIELTYEQVRKIISKPSLP
ncbi:MAG: hypothetical protein JRI59_07565 [Deltaproteobacteria bacterium]|nr:hypothetical protein [Deltaproteobacteria bacterium]